MPGPLALLQDLQLLTELPPQVDKTELAEEVAAHVLADHSEGALRNNGADGDGDTNYTADGKTFSNPIADEVDSVFESSPRASGKSDPMRKSSAKLGKVGRHRSKDRKRAGLSDSLTADHVFDSVSAY